MSDNSQDGVTNESVKTVPMLEEDMKAIKDKVAMLANIASVAHPYTPFDRMMFTNGLENLKKLINDFSNETQLAINYLGQSRSQLFAVEDKLGFLLSYAETLSRLSGLANNLEEVETLVNAYISQYKHHA